MSDAPSVESCVQTLGKYEGRLMVRVSLSPLYWSLQRDQELARRVFLANAGRIASRWYHRRSLPLYAPCKAEDASSIPHPGGPLRWRERVVSPRSATR